jgi:hypothetical protein
MLFNLIKPSNKRAACTEGTLPKSVQYRHPRSITHTSFLSECFLKKGVPQAIQINAIRPLGNSTWKHCQVLHQYFFYIYVLIFFLEMQLEGF